MSYEDADRAAMGRYFSLSEDKQTERILIVGEPQVIHTQSKWGPRTRFCFPVLLDGELMIYAVGKVDYKQIKESRDKLDSQAVEITRRGKAGSLKTVYLYDLKAQTPEETEVRSNVSAADIAEMFEDQDVPF